MANAANPLLNHPGEVNGDATVTIRAERAGLGLVRFLRRGENPTLTSTNGFSSFDFCNVRVFPSDDYSGCRTNP